MTFLALGPSAVDRDPLDRLTWLAAGYAIVIAALFVLQWIPFTGIFMMMVGGPFWIGAVVHVFMIHLAALSLLGRVPVVALALPVAFYAGGAALGLKADVEARRWIEGRTWLTVEAGVPFDVRFLAIDPWNRISKTALANQTVPFEPERAGFTLAHLALREGIGFRGNVRLDPVDVTGRCQTRGQRRSEIGGRCYAHVPIERPWRFLVLGGETGEPRRAASTKPQTLSWGSIFEASTPLVLHDNGRRTVVARLSGALIRKEPYVLWPTAGCFLNSSGPSWNCFWTLTAPIKRRQNVGFSPSPVRASPDSAGVLMQALEGVRRGRI